MTSTGNFGKDDMDIGLWRDSLLRDFHRSENEEDKSPATHPPAKPRRSSHYVSSAMLGLVGQIPANTIGNLTQLRILSLRANRLSGSIPSNFSNLKLLRSLYLQNNLFSGKYDSNNGFSGSKLLRSVVKLRWRRQQPGLAHCRNLRRRHRRRHRRPMPRCSPSAATASANVGVATASAITGCTRYVIYVKKGTYKENVVIGSSKKLIIMVACTLLCFFYDNGGDKNRQKKLYLSLFLFASLNSRG
ncbi:unnamed protein product [Camellia sinensis]